MEPYYLIDLTDENTYSVTLMPSGNRLKTFAKALDALLWGDARDDDREVRWTLRAVTKELDSGEDE